MVAGLIHVQLGKMVGIYGHDPLLITQTATALLQRLFVLLEKKEKLLQLYTSQAHTIQGLSHMNPYEMWTQTRGGAADDTAA